MKFSRNKVQPVAASLFFLLSFSINAYPVFNDKLIEFSLSVQGQSSNFKFSTTTDKVKSDQIGISWYEPFSKYFQGGLEVGYIEMSQINNPVLSSQFTSGQYAGLLLRFLPVDKPNLSVLLNLNYRYTRTKGATTTQTTQFAWHETVFSSEIQFHPVEQISLFLAAEYQLLNGEQRDSSTITKISLFSENKQEGYRIGLNFMPYRTGIIGVEWFSGFRDGGRLYFKRIF
ncbi:MAG: hypothetical protein BMS9Abin31_0331 [Gammaproteobacteria bacterium]|nr:MAG: hypothetical protein BMS9Abin31_0331 [Gammaproteobacteria bacterium]